MFWYFNFFLSLCKFYTPIPVNISSPISSLHFLGRGDYAVCFIVCTPLFSGSYHWSLSPESGFVLFPDCSHLHLTPIFSSELVYLAVHSVLFRHVMLLIK